MGLVHGSATFCRYEVEGTLPEDYIETFPGEILRYAFHTLDGLPGEERSTGWVNILDMFDNEFRTMEYFKEPFVALSWRVDVKRIPKKALLHYCREAEKEVKEREGLEYLPKATREEIRESVRLRLLKRAIPQSGVYDMVWNLQTNTVFFGATGSKLCDEFAEFFRKTFHLQLIPLYPYALAQQALIARGKDSALAEEIRPLYFAEGPRA
jgi:DNA recombination-dependent growth factor C